MAEVSPWIECLRQLEAEVPEQLFNVWVRPLQAVDDGRRNEMAAGVDRLEGWGGGAVVDGDDLPGARGIKDLAQSVGELTYQLARPE